MAFWSSRRRTTSGEGSGLRSVNEVVEENNMVSYDMSPESPFVVVERPGRMPIRRAANSTGGSTTTLAERTDDAVKLSIGHSGTNIDSFGSLTGEQASAVPSPWTSWLRQEYNSELQDIKGIQKYDQMRRSDATVRASLRLMKTPILAAQWFMEPYSESSRDQAAADLVWWNLVEGMSIPFNQVLYESLFMLDYGCYLFEKVFEFRVVDGVERVIWKKLAPRHPVDIKEWKFDRNGGLNSISMYTQTGSDYTLSNGVFTGTSAAEVTIPVSKLLIFTFDKEGGDPTGMSLLRSAYRHWFYKDELYKIDAIQKERHGIGIPIIKLPAGASPEDKRLAEELGRNLRTNERAHVTLPALWEFEFAELRMQPVDVLRSIEHHDKMIQQNILAPFMSSPNISDSESPIFLKSGRYIANIICDVFNKYAIPQLIDLNYTRLNGYPKLKFRRIGEQADWRTLSFAIRNFVGANVLTPDERLEKNLRESMDLPDMDPTTQRQIPTKGAGAPAPAKPSNMDNGQRSSGGSEKPTPPRVGLPRQQPLPPVGLPHSNSGGDRSGG